MNAVTMLADGTKVRLLNPSLKGVTIDTIATQLAKICRFNGACEGFYSVARHSVIGALSLYRKYDKATGAAFLMHDAHEVLTGDVITPVAQALSPPNPAAWKQDACRVSMLKVAGDRAIEKRFGVDITAHMGRVHQMDRELLHYEWDRLMPGNPDAAGIAPPHRQIVPEDLMYEITGYGEGWIYDRSVFIDTAKLLGVRG